MNLRCEDCGLVMDMKVMEKCWNCDGISFKTGYGLDGTNLAKFRGNSK